jgi:transglutaminase-like putative cysteine protease
MLSSSIVSQRLNIRLRMLADLSIEISYTFERFVDFCFSQLFFHVVSVNVLSETVDIVLALEHFSECKHILRFSVKIF